MADHAHSSLAVEHRPLATLHPDPRNPRQHSDRQIKQIARSIESFGFNVPLLIDGNSKILAGHGRVLAAKRLGWQAVPVIRLEHLTPAQASAFAIADNRLTEIATWDDRLLGEVFNDLAALDLDFSLEDTGFSMAEIDLRIEGLSDGSRAKPDPADDLSEMVNAAPVTQAGDLWLLHGHRVSCADALDRAAYQTLMGRSRADLVSPTHLTTSRSMAMPPETGRFATASSPWPPAR
jgi:ParB-like chromosome segregation protein Spo0J